MKRMLHGFTRICWFYLMCLTLVATDTTTYAEVGKNIILPCEANADGKFLWRKNKDQRIIERTATNLILYFKVPSERLKLWDLSLEIIKVQLEDSGSYTCENKIKPVHVKLVVFEISVNPAPLLLMSENLVLTLKSSPEQDGLLVSWKLPATVKNVPTNGKSVEIPDVRIEHGGKYTCHIKTEGGEELSYTKDIEIKGFYGAPDAVYISGPSVTLPWRFNFPVRRIPLLGQVEVTGGGLYYSLEKGRELGMLSNLSVSSGVCWPRNCSAGGAKGQDLDVHLWKPRGGWYRMALTLKMEARNKYLYHDVCAAELKVTFSTDEPLTMNSQITLSCNASCMPTNGILRWHSNDNRTVASGERGQTDLAWTMIVLPETVGTWTCSLFTEERRQLSADLTLVEEMTIERVLLWAGIGGAVFLLLAAALIITVVVARCRRRRRASHRAWLIQTLHQQKICECRGFAPSRLRERCAD